MPRLPPGDVHASSAVVAAVILVVDIEIGLISADLIAFLINDLGPELDPGIASLAFLGPAIAKVQFEVAELGRFRLGRRQDQERMLWNWHLSSDTHVRAPSFTDQ